jgi:hypothetical protein
MGQQVAKLSFEISMQLIGVAWNVTDRRLLKANAMDCQQAGNQRRLRLRRD